MYMSSDFTSRKHATIVLHNDLIKASYSMTPYQLRIFKAMLCKLVRTEGFSAIKIPNNELVDTTYTSNDRWSRIKQAAESMESIMVNGEQLVSQCRYTGYTGYVEATFSPAMSHYLLNINKTGNWTMAPIKQIEKTKTFAGFRLYWFMKQYSTFKDGSQRIISFDKLKAMLGLDGKYDNYQNFRKRVLEPVREELAETDMAFEYEDKKAGRSVDAIMFSYAKGVSLLDLPADADVSTMGDWSQALTTIGIDNKGLIAINALMEAKVVCSDYIMYCIKHYKMKQANKQIKTSLHGAIYSGIVHDYMRKEFEQDKKRRKVTVNPTAKPAKPAAPAPSPAAVQAKADAVKQWDGCLEYIKAFVGGQSYQTWFTPLVPVEYNKNNKTLTIQVPSQLYYDWLEEHYVDTLRDALFNVIGNGAKLEYSMVTTPTTA